MRADATFYECDVMVARLIWIAGSVANMSDDLHDFFFESDAGDIKKLIGIEIESTMEDEEVLDLLVRSHKMGFLAQLQTPVPREFSPDKSAFSCSWGYTQTQWFYVEDITRLPSIAGKFREAILAREKQKQDATP